MYRLIVGLGNPGAEYEGTRHNIGFQIVDNFASKQNAADWKKERSFKSSLTSVNIRGQKILLLKPGAFMNLSGACLQKVSSFYKIPPVEIIVIYDEMNIELGQRKVSLKGSAGGHNGMLDIINRIHPVFTRLRIGIGPKAPPEIDLADFVLGKFKDEEIFKINASMDQYIDCIERLLFDGPEKAMIHINKRIKNDD
ncbi:aminoacyl-tRNA hydrolase [Puniceicoccaceae bacterium K14]|nr:aminoacyl-tRNA hydrolase [Puniceicoccaceae bacterium K14]